MTEQEYKQSRIQIASELAKIKIKIDQLQADIERFDKNSRETMAALIKQATERLTQTK